MRPSSSDWRIFRCRPSAPGQVDPQKPPNALFDGAAHGTNSQACSSAFVSSSSACSSSRTESAAQWKTELEECEERELAEAIRMSLAESQPNDSTDKAAVACVSRRRMLHRRRRRCRPLTRRLRPLANGFVFPLQLDFSTSRAASHYQRRNIPTPTAQKSVLSNLSYSAQNQSVCFYSPAGCAAGCGRGALETTGVPAEEGGGGEGGGCVG
ncbi:hypothetical protein B0H14DRAFT_152736 [Mycena olivaceomarginata]|nr:hypothetical protein B0H14DRAFT_152736 [Mycena olivaceomarginata]